MKKLKKLKVLSLFDGISCGRIALERAGILIDTYYASEIEPSAIKISKHNYPDIIRLGDVKKWRSWNIPWGEIDLIIGGSPCQSLSIIQSKTRKNLNGKSKLFFEYVDILNHTKQFNPDVKFLFENVDSMNDESRSAIEYCLGTKLIYQNSDAFSAQERPRVYGTNFDWQPMDKPCDLVLKDIMEDIVDEKYFYNYPLTNINMNKQVCATMQYDNYDMHKRIFNPEFKVHTLTTCNGGNLQKKVMVNGRARKLTPLEYERLQTVPDNYTACVCDTARYSALGNGWTVDVIAYILNNLK